jgi:hypothetical protein
MMQFGLVALGWYLVVLCYVGLVMFRYVVLGLLCYVSQAMLVRSQLGCVRLCCLCFVRLGWVGLVRSGQVSWLRLG